MKKIIVLVGFVLVGCQNPSGGSQQGGEIFSGGILDIIFKMYGFGFQTYSPEDQVAYSANSISLYNGSLLVNSFGSCDEMDQNLETGFSDSCLFLGRIDSNSSAGVAGSSGSRDSSPSLGPGSSVDAGSVYALHSGWRIFSTRSEVIFARLLVWSRTVVAFRYQSQFYFSQVSQEIGDELAYPVEIRTFCALAGTVQVEATGGVPSCGFGLDSAIED